MSSKPGTGERVPRLRDRLRARLPEIALEAASVIFAVLLALGVNEWRQNRADAALAAHARQLVVEEVRQNRDEVAQTLESHRALAVAIANTLERLDAASADDEGDVSLAIDFVLMESSSAAWETAKVTEAMQHLDFVWVMRAARVYSLQELCATTQIGFLDTMASPSGPHDEAPRRWFHSLSGRLHVIIGLEEGLLKAQDELLGDAAEPGSRAVSE